MGTVVFPDADLKIFLTAKPEVRAMRRYRDLLEKFPDVGATLRLEEIVKEVETRDRNDRERSISPLRQADDAILIDTSEMSVEQVIGAIITLFRKQKNTFPAMKPFYRIVYGLARWFFKTFFRLRIFGVSHFRKGSGLIIANHASFYDPPVLSISCPEEVHFLAKESLFRVPLLGRVIRRLNSHPIHYDAADVKTLKKAVQLLRQGKKLIVFPEGERSADGRLQPFERGLAFLARSARCPIFPAYLEGTFAAWPIVKKIPKLTGHMTCVFGSPIEWEERAGRSKKEAEEELLVRCAESIRALQAWLEGGAQGEPP